MEKQPDKKPEQQEQIEAGTLTANELKEIIFQGHGGVQDKRFLPTKDGGVFQFFTFDKLCWPGMEDRLVFPNVKINGKIVALASVQKVMYEENLWGVGFVSVDPEHEGKKLASKLIEEIFRYAKSAGIKIRGSDYVSDEAKLKLKRKLLEMAKKYEVEYIDYDEMMNI